MKKVHLEFLNQRFVDAGQADAIIWHGRVFSYHWLSQRMSYWEEWLSDHGVGAGSVVSIEADFSANSIALFLTLINAGAILVPLTGTIDDKLDEFLEIGQVQYRLCLNQRDDVSLLETGQAASHELYQELRRRDNPGLVLFSSGSTGKSKAAVHDLTGILQKFRTLRHCQRTVSFLLYDHIGGVNTMLHTLSNAGCLIAISDRDPDLVLESVAQNRAEVLPASSSFLNLILLSEAHRRHDISSLKIVTYGTEPMSEVTLKRFHAEIPQVKLLQTYGLSEIGILRSKSLADDSLWVKVGGEGFETRVIDGLLEIKAQSAMMGYLNAPNPFSDDGWFMTGDVVEQDGEYLKFLGRSSDLINIGGEKVYPAEIENVLQTMTGVDDVTVMGEANAISGKIVVAQVKLSTDESLGEFRKRMRHFCADKLASFKIPQKVVLVCEVAYGNRFKKIRRNL
jgi:long-chain acyl-CoA synthetase